MNNEEWRSVRGYEGIYEVSNIGRIRSLITLYASKPKILIQTVGKRGYCTVQLRDGYTGVTKTTHRLVAEAFVPNIQGLECVNHIDGDKENNHMDNLAWCTHAENLQHAYDTNLRKTRKVAQYTLEGKLVMIYSGCADAGRKNKSMNKNSISRCARGVNSTAYGYIWMYVDEN